MAIDIADKDEQSLSHFISNSPWRDEPLIEAIGRDAAQLLSGGGGYPQGAGALILDESGIPKPCPERSEWKGSESVGVTRQYCGALGKVDNCQVGVFLAYSTSTEATLIDRRLYLPAEWVNDPDRCERACPEPAEGAGIPLEERKFCTKAQLGLEMILKAKERGVPFEFQYFSPFAGDPFQYILSPFPL